MCMLHKIYLEQLQTNSFVLIKYKFDIQAKHESATGGEPFIGKNRGQPFLVVSHYGCKHPSSVLHNP